MIPGHDVYSDMKPRENGKKQIQKKNGEERNVASFSYLPQIQGVARPNAATTENSSRVMLPDFSRK